MCNSVSVFCICAYGICMWISLVVTKWVSDPWSWNYGSLSCHVGDGNQAQVFWKRSKWFELLSQFFNLSVSFLNIYLHLLDVSWDNHKRTHQPWRVESLQWEYNRRSEGLCVCKVQWPPPEVHGEPAVLRLSESLHILKQLCHWHPAPAELRKAH